MAYLSVFVPVALWLDRLASVPPVLRFVAAALAIIPLSALMVRATEQLAARVGATAGGLLNATFGNAPELIISLMALQAGLLDVVKASIVGVILGNLLFVLGFSFLIGGCRFHVQKFNRRGARSQRSMLMLAVMAFVVPSLFTGFISPPFRDHEAALNLGVALVLLTTYISSLLYMLKTHPEDFRPKNGDTQSVTDGAGWSVAMASLTLLFASAVLALMSEILVGSIEPTAESLHWSRAFIGVIVIALIGGAPESVGAVAMARKDQLDLTMGIAVGSSIQIALFVAPVLVLSSYVLAPRPLDLVLGQAGISLVLLSILIFSLIVGDGKSNWFKGVQLLSVYLLIALFCFFLPDDRSIPWLKP